MRSTADKAPRWVYLQCRESGKNWIEGTPTVVLMEAELSSLRNAMYSTSIYSELLLLFIVDRNRHITGIVHEGYTVEDRTMLPESDAHRVLVVLDSVLDGLYEIVVCHVMNGFCVLGREKGLCELPTCLALIRTFT